MKKIIISSLENCVGCNRCARECPIETANLTYQDAAGNIKVDVDDSQCIACGRCIQVCEHNARSYTDDLEQFFKDLQKGEPLSLITAPSLKSNFPKWKNILAWLKTKGVRKIYDVSLGADICIWAYLRYIDAYKPVSLITQPCPAIVSYCELHRHDLLDRLSPVHSPMACAAIYMTRYKGITDKIAALSPCIAKSHEFESIGMIDYNITFARLQEYIDTHGIELPDEEAEFDHYDSGLGAIFPMPGGLKENIEFFIGQSIRVDKSEGFSVYRSLDEYATTPENVLPGIFDVLNCAEGCNIGPGGVSDVNMFQLHAAMDAGRKAAASRDRAYYEDLHRKYDAAFDLSHFLREYKPVYTGMRSVSDADIQLAFAQMDKDTFAKQNINCGACGSNTCADMARKIALNINIPINCIYKSRDDAETEHRKNAQYIGLVHQLGENLISFMENEYSDAVINSLRDVSDVFDCNLSSLWKVERIDGKYQCSRLFYYTDSEDGELFKVRKEWPVAWLDKLSNGEHLIMSRTEVELEFFSEKGTLFIAVPIMIKGMFWGFITLITASLRNYTNEEISAIGASGILIVSAIHGKELEENAYIDSLTGIYNRRYFMEFATRQFDKLKRTNGSCCAMMLDLDFFKQINDNYGHHVGDEVLRLTAAHMKEGLRSYDLLARYGGEEFVIFLSDIDEKFAVEFAERIRKSVESASGSDNWNGIPITLSIGLALNQGVNSLQEMLQQADKALYAAKRNGRNQTCIYQGEETVFYGNPLHANLIAVKSDISEKDA
ncbi:diguanylate cyclase [Oxalobacter sp. OttesenSCG-928-P03]|nr:diguanylate cyclase [Oxalobacter sp. OttesenSCG-928-P03]